MGSCLRRNDGKRCWVWSGPVLRCPQRFLGRLMGPCLRRDDGREGLLRLLLLRGRGYGGLDSRPRLRGGRLCAGMTGGVLGAGDRVVGIADGFLPPQERREEVLGVEWAGLALSAAVPGKADGFLPPQERRKGGRDDGRRG